MLRQDQVQTLRQTHRTVTTMLPLITAGLTVAGAMIAAMESKDARDGRDAREEQSAQDGASAAGTGEALATVMGRRAGKRERGGVRRTVATLAGRLLLVLLGAAVVAALTLAATTTGRVGLAVTLTALTLMVFYLAEKAARQA